MSRLSLIAAACLALSACAEIPVSSTAGPGPQAAQPDVAAKIFYDVCVAPLPNYDTSVAALTRYPFTRHATFGTYYHTEQNLSVKLQGTPTSECSMVFGVKAGEGATGEAVSRFVEGVNAQSPIAGTDVSIGARPGPDGNIYINARTKSPQ